MTPKQIIAWLLQGDVAIRYQTYRDLFSDDKVAIRRKITKEGWGLRFLSAPRKNGHWGRGFYQPKWTSSHYTLLDLKQLGILPGNKLVNETLDVILDMPRSADGGIFPVSNLKVADMCINGMVLNYASYFQVKEELLKSVIDFILSGQLSDGGFNCEWNRKQTHHSSLHTTLSVLEGILEFSRNGYTYRLNELMHAKKAAEEFILVHHLFRSHKTGEVIRKAFLSFPYPARWRYDILRVMDYFRDAETAYDSRMEEALSIILNKRTKEGAWMLPAQLPGQRHFEMERTGSPSRWNTLRALRVLSYYTNKLNYHNRT